MKKIISIIIVLIIVLSSMSLFANAVKGNMYKYYIKCQSLKTGKIKSFIQIAGNETNAIIKVKLVAKKTWNNHKSNEIKIVSLVGVEYNPNYEM